MLCVNLISSKRHELGDSNKQCRHLIQVKAKRWYLCICNTYRIPVALCAGRKCKNIHKTPPQYSIFFFSFECLNHLIDGEPSNGKHSKQERRKHQFNIFVRWWEGGFFFFPHCILNEFKTVFQTAGEQLRFSGDFVSRRAIIWAFWQGSSSRDPGFRVQCLFALGKRSCYLPLLFYRDQQLHLLFFLLGSFRTELSP